mmetsp:Transcript_12283/g.31175  ORF Transcript_12283/g.31175 Transcript_12283/m.31175 type:complete len:225 (-) Transcript_12283:567-1241(-)
MYVSTSKGGFNWITRSTSAISSPRAATSVATRMLNFPCLNPAIVTSRCACAMSPCSTWQSFATQDDSAISFASFFVSAKMMHLPLRPLYRRITSPSVACFTEWGQQMAKCLTSWDVWILSFPIRSTVIRSGAMYLGAIFLIQAGMVAENRSVWCFCVIFLRISSIESANPMFNISSASSRMTNSTACKFRVPRLMWSMIRPAVPTTTSTPRLRAFSCGAYGAPP